MFSIFKSDLLPDRYQEFVKTQLLTIDEILLDGNTGVDSAKDHRDALNHLLKGRPGDAIDYLFDAHKKYENIGIEQCTPHLLKAKGDCILNAIIISNVYEEKYDLIDFKPDSQLAFSYLWLSFELSHLKLYSSLVSLSELFLFFAEGTMIMMAGFIQTMPPSHFPEFFSVVCEYLRNVSAAQALRSLGSSETRYIKKLNVDLSQKEKTQKVFYKSEIESADKRIGELATYIGNKYHMPNLRGIDYKRMLTAIEQPISKDDNVSYLELFGIMIRNLKKSSGGKRITELFKNIPISKEDALQNENYYGLFTLVYTDMYREENKKTDEEVSDELFEIAQESNAIRNHGFAGLIAQEALFFARGDKRLVLKRFIEMNTVALMEKETGINLIDDDLPF